MRTEKNTMYAIKTVQKIRLYLVNSIAYPLLILISNILVSSNSIIFLYFKLKMEIDLKLNAETQNKNRSTSILIEGADLEPFNIEQSEQTQEEVSFLQLFRFATKTEIILMVIGTICCALMGVSVPVFVILWGKITDTFGDSVNSQDAAKSIMASFFYVGLGTFAAGWGMFACWMIAGERQSITCRKEYLKSLLRQQIGWFDTNYKIQLSTQFAADCFAFSGAIGQKFSIVLMTISMVISGFVTAFVYGWLMTLVMICSLPVIALGGYVLTSTSTKKEENQEKDYSEAGGIAEQSFSAIKTVKQLNGEEFTAKRYALILKSVTQNSSKYGVLIGIGMGILFFAILSSYSIGFWFGSLCVEGSSSCLNGNPGSSKYTTGDLVIVFLCVLQTGFTLGQIAPGLKKISEGRVAANRIFKMIDRKPLIRSPQNGGIIPTKFKGVFRFQNVTFAYPKDKSKNIITKLNLEINTKTSAFVGESGCGKSTIFQLIMRFYDPDQGKVTLDGVNLKQINLAWLRSQIGYVGQEPVLFATTIRQNLLFGKEDATDKEIEEALIKAEAFQFVNMLKNKLQTYVGTGGGQLSGGQKQRLAIARAILKNPKILLLDEATSALDRRNEILIQKTLSQLSEDKITITIAHRVKTIMNSDKIFVLSEGRVKQQGQFINLEKFKKLDMEEQQCQGAQQINIIKKAIKPGQQNPLPVNEDLKQQEKEEQLEVSGVYYRLFGYTKGRRVLFVFGLFIAICNGLIFPIFTIFLSQMVGTLIQFSSNPSKARADANLCALIFLILAIAAFFLSFLQQIIFISIGEKMTENIRNETFFKILKMPVAWFEKKSNSSGFLSVRLASDCKNVKNLVTTLFSILVQTLATLISAVAIALAYEWRTALVAAGLLPTMVLAGIMEMKFSQGFGDQTDKVFKESSNLISEAINSIRTVTSFGSEQMFEKKYSAKLLQPMSFGIKKGVFSGFAYGLVQITMFFACGIILYLGIVFMVHNNLPMENVFTAIYSIIVSGMIAGNNGGFMPDVGAAQKSAASIFQILDSVDEDQLQVSTGSKMLKTPIQGNIVFQNVTFKYESREEPALVDLSLQILAGQKIGFVGHSGCGKSTILQLLQRFYDVDSGKILVDGIDIKDYDIHYLRSFLGVVSQQPVLFNDTIQENIKYNRTDLLHEQIVAAANESNFNPQMDATEQMVGIICTKKQLNDDRIDNQEKCKSKQPFGTGFNKNVGARGSHISGGQKQRVAIARAIVRNPQILLLDQATSALDSSNEKKVQDSLDRMMNGKTSITIAHRLDAIKNSDKIVVFHHGKIVESGIYQRLMEMKQNFYRLEKGLEVL